jgi:hypothetical protein
MTVLSLSETPKRGSFNYSFANQPCLLVGGGAAIMAGKTAKPLPLDQQ